MSNQEHDESLISTLSERIWNGLVKENPTFVLLLGMCPTLAVTTSAINGLGMGVTTLVVLALSNFMISALRKVIPDKVRIPAFIVIIASFVTIVELLLKAYIPSLYDALGLYIPLIVVNCIILGRAESYAYSHKVLPSLFDGIGMGMGFTLALTIIGGFREILGSGKIFDYTIMPEGFVPVSIFVMAPGAFFVLAMLTALQNLIKDAGTKRGKDMSKIQSGCGGNCLDCTKECADRGSISNASKEAKKEKKAKEKAKSKKEAVSEGKDESTLDVQAEKETVNALVTADNEIESKAAEAINLKAETELTKANSLESDIASNESSIDKAKEENSVVIEKAEESKETKALAPKIKTEKTKTEKAKAEKVKVEKPKTEKSKTEKPKVVKEKPSNDPVNEEEDELVLLDLNDYKKAISKTTPSGKKPVRKKASIEKAQAMLSKANDSLKEDKNND